MEQCPYCGSAVYENETVNQVEIKKCKSCGAYYEDAGKEMPWSEDIDAFVPVYERDSHGEYPGCPKCGSRKFREVTRGDRVLRHSLLASELLGVPWEPASVVRRKYECLNPSCGYRWS